MWFRLFHRPTRKVRWSAPAPRFRPTLEALEQREVLASPGSLHAPALGSALVSSITPTLQQISSILPLSFTNVAVQNGQVVASGLLGNHAFTTTLTGTLSAGATAATPILDLHLNAIHLNVLGLHVDTSDICLTITAQPGAGLLGDLLGGVSNLLNNGPISLTSLFNSLSTQQANQLSGQLTKLLNGVLGALENGNATVGGMASNGACNILNLSLGPVDLTLLGLNVHLDNCADGPVTLDITAQRGPGNLLGNLLCGLSSLLDNGNVNLGALSRRLDRIGHVIGDILGGVL